MTNKKENPDYSNFQIRVDATEAKEYEGRPSDFFLCHTPLIKDTHGVEGEYVLQNEWPFVMSQVLKFPDEAAASAFMASPHGQSVPCVRVRHVVLRMSCALADVAGPEVPLSPQEVGCHINNIFPKAAHWYRCVVMEQK